MEKGKTNKILDVRNLCYAYYKNPLCINDASFFVNTNQKVLLLGEKEMGKTTMLKALSSFDDTYFGQVFFKGKDLKQYDDKDKNFSLILADPVLLKSSIRKNIDFLCETIGKEKLSDSEIEEFLKLFKIDAFAKTKVSKLSLFEKRKLALLRAWIKKPEILFLDDQFEGLTADESSIMTEIYDMFFGLKDLTIIAALGAESVCQNIDYFKNLKLNKIEYVSFTKTYEFDDMNDFFDKKFNFDVLSFSPDYCYEKSYIVRDNGAYFYVTPNDSWLKFDKLFYDKLSMLSLTDGENEDAYLCCLKEKPLDELNNQEFNKRLKNKDLWIFSALDKSRII